MKEKDKENLKDSSLSLKNLIDIREWQKIQDNFSVITDVCLRTVDAKGNRVTSPSKEPRLCNQLLKESQWKTKLCEPCLPTFLGGQGVVDKNLSFTCHAGLCNFIAPLKMESKALGYIILGPLILVMRKSKEQYRQTADELNLDLEDFWNAILEIKVISFQGVQSLIELIRDVCEYTLKLAYRNITQGKEGGMALGAAKLNRILDILLDVAFELSQADRGSVMFFDESQKNFTIWASKGIPDEIARNTRVKLGEGISGIAAQEEKSFLIDDNTRDGRIRPYLNRPFIGSAMVLPIKIENRVVGVMNLGTLKTSSVRFDADNLRMMKKLVDLATVAITPVK